MFLSGSLGARALSIATFCSHVAEERLGLKIRLGVDFMFFCWLASRLRFGFRVWVLVVHGFGFGPPKP